MGFWVIYFRSTIKLAVGGQSPPELDLDTNATGQSVPANLHSGYTTLRQGFVWQAKIAQTCGF
jgi:hypothetical protein